MFCDSNLKVLRPFLYILPFLILEILPLVVFTQTLPQSQPQLQLSFLRQNNFTYSTRLGLKYQYQKAKYSFELKLKHDNIYNSSRKENPFIQFYLQTHLWQYYQLNDSWDFVSWLEADQFFNATSHRVSLYVGARYKWKDILSLTPLVGYSLDYRSMIPDNGFSPALVASARYRWSDGLTMETRGSARVKFISPRIQKNFQLMSNWGRSFGEFADLNFGFQAGSNELDNYTLSNTAQIRLDTFAIEQIISDTLSPFLGLKYRLMPNLYWESDNRLVFSRRQLDYQISNVENSRLNDLSFDQLQVLTQQKVSYSRKKISAYFVYQYQYLARRYELENTIGLPASTYERQREREKQKDYFRDLNTFELKVSYQLKPRHSLNLSANNRYLRYDTPGEGNFDDHDQLNYGLAIEWRSAWSSKFSTGYKLLGQLRRYAFLFKERSQDNYTQRSLRLEFDYRWMPLPKLSISGEQDIYVTYHVKDFGDRNQTDRSTRNLESNLEVNYRLNAKWDIKLEAYRRENHVSYLNWLAFTETTLDTTITYIIEQTSSWEIKKWKQNILYLDIGYKHFSQSRLFNTAMTNLNNILTPINLHARNFQTGPQTAIRLVQRFPASMNLAIWWQFQYQDFIFKEIPQFISLSSNYRQTQLQQTTFNFRPFVKLQLNVFLQK